MLTANDIAPSYAGIVFGISNTFATIPGIVSPYIVGALTEKVSFFNHYTDVFYVYKRRIQAIGVLFFSFVQLSILSA
jgi:ACS family sodium-dependent inorganic phosphate cotransporter-like MFS transporter 5